MNGTVTPSADAPKRRTPGWLKALAVVVLLVAGALFVWGYYNPPAQTPRPAQTASYDPDQNQSALLSNNPPQAGSSLSWLNALLATVESTHPDGNDNIEGARIAFNCATNNTGLQPCITQFAGVQMLHGRVIDHRNSGASRIAVGTNANGCPTLTAQIDGKHLPVATIARTQNASGTWPTKWNFVHLTDNWCTAKTHTVQVMMFLTGEINKPTDTLIRYGYPFTWDESTFKEFLHSFILYDK